MNSTTCTYFNSLDIFYRYYSDINNDPKCELKQYVYSAIFALPQPSIIDFGVSKWPSDYNKKDVCPRALFVQNWSDGKLGFIGGKVENQETILEAMNREFYEETGSEFKFQDNHYAFTIFNSEKNSATHLYLLVLNNVTDMEDIIINFTKQSHREAYLDEVFSLSCIPLFIEGPYDDDISNYNIMNIWGLPKFLTLHGGIFSPTLQNDYKVREILIVMLLYSKIIDENLMKRIFKLANSFINGNDRIVLLPTFEDFLNISGVKSVINLNV